MVNPYVYGCARRRSPFYYTLSMILLGSLILLFGALVALLVFGDHPRFRGTLVHSAYQAVNRANVKISLWVSRTTTTNPAVGLVLRWLVPIFYVVIVSYCIHLFFANVYGNLPSSVTQSYLHTMWIAFSIAALAASTALVTFSDPGRLDSSNLHAAFAVFPYNGLIFFPRFCKTCNLQRPARSKHCSTCGTCVLLFDHHCLWVNNCVGLKNYRWFMAYLLLNINLMAYGGYLCFLELLDQKQHYPSLSWWRLITKSTENNRISGILAILCVVFVPISSIFTMLHIRYLYLGVTTNEADKWGEIEHLVGLGALVYIEEQQQYAETATMRDTDGTYKKAYLDLNDEAVLLTSEEETKFTIRKVALMEADLVNIYDKGFWNNVHERIISLPM